MLAVLTYLDRVCISVAGPRIQNELHLGPQDWGLVTGAFCKLLARRGAVASVGLKTGDLERARAHSQR
jgi:hypothetical protein